MELFDTFFVWFSQVLAVSEMKTLVISHSHRCVAISGKITTVPGSFQNTHSKMITNSRLWMYTLNGIVWNLFFLVWSSIGCFRDENVSHNPAGKSTHETHVARMIHEWVSMSLPLHAWTLHRGPLPCMNLAWVSPSMHEPCMGLPFHSWTLHGSPLPCVNLSWVSTSMHEPCKGLPLMHEPCMGLPF